MQNETFKRFSRDIQDVLVMPMNNYLSKKTSKKLSRASGLSGLTIDGHPPQNHGHHHHHHHHHHHQKEKDVGAPLSSASTADSVSLHNFSLSTISKASSDGNQSFTSSNGSTNGFVGCQQQHSQTPPPLPLHHLPSNKGPKISTSAKALNFLKSPRSPLSPSHYGKVGIFPKEEQPALIHCPPSVASLDQFSQERHDWVLKCLNHHHQGSKDQGATTKEITTGTPATNSDILKSETAWDAVEGYEYAQLHVPLSTPAEKSGYHNPNEATGLVFIKLMQVSNRASAKVFDIECSLRIGSCERTSHPTRSFKDNPGNTATMNEVFLFDVNAPFQLEIDVTGTPIATKFGTMAGFSNTQQVQLGQLHLDLPLETMDNSVRTFKLKRVLPPSAIEGSQPTHSIKSLHAKEKADCEIIVMMGIHILKEPVEDKSWETETLYQGNLTVMTRGSRRSAWKRYWAVLEGSSFKLYDAEYQMKRDPVAVISLGHIRGIQPPDYDKVDVGANGFSIVLEKESVDLSSKKELFEHDPLEFEQLDYNVYAFTDSAYLHEIWNASLEEALEQYRENMQRREEVQIAKRGRRRLWLNASSGTNNGRRAPLEDIAEEEDGGVNGGRLGLVDLRFVS
ncbi:hypothetical protein BGZ83_005454 [Gryganskiella cystojenkinii]|nr:hypothetical protein BGZ83_005454 [Gryganskiella cystojenkinii]